MTNHNVLLQGSVLQAYFARCITGSQADLVQAQCKALPLDCSVPAALSSQTLQDIVLEAVIETCEFAGS